MKTFSTPHPRLLGYFNEYDRAHTHFGNEVCHFVGIIILLISILGLLSRWVILATPLQVDGAALVIGSSLFWYFYLDWKITIPLVLFFMGCLFIGKTMSLPLLWALFALGWFFQFFGHYYFEKKSPAFFQNVLHTFVGPAWVFSRMVGYYR